ncbi:MAG: riboflavin biosynthesis protein RibF [Clostridia bacterium]|nr:riboflavin biosynthesis protein RibF [Clostridia bacterium]
MQIFRLAPGNPARIFPDAVPHSAVFLLGCFDGVHTGHQTLLSRARAMAENHVPVVVWTMENHKKASVQSGLLTTAEEKLALFHRFGADYAVLENFEDLCGLDGRTFFETHIIAPFSPSAVVCGENFRFGKNAACGADDLSAFAKQADIRCTVCSLLTSQSTPVSSTEIRKKILAGDVKSAHALLGYPYTVTAPVLHGKALGRTIGCPTVNQRLPKEKVMPARGVYACTVSFTQNGTDFTRQGVCNIGSRPTVNADESDITLETFILDFSADLYGLPLTTRLYDRIRGEQAFADVHALSEQIRRDAETARTLLAGVPLL